MRRRILLSIPAALAFLATAHPALAGPKLYKVMVLTGWSDRDWRATTPEIVGALDETKRFKVTVVTTPDRSAGADIWDAFHPFFGQYDAVVCNWTDAGGPPPPVTKWMDDLINFVRNGGAFVAVNTAGLAHHPSYPDLVGLVRRGPGFGSRIALTDGQRVVRTPVGEGPGPEHDALAEWVVRMWSGGGPISAGLPSEWLHVRDELWYGLRGPALRLKVVATTVGPKTGLNEPVMWTVEAGQGRVFVTLLGHDAEAMRCIGFRTTLARGCEWAITGRVTLKAPAKFPTAVRTSEVGP